MRTALLEALPLPSWHWPVLARVAAASSLDAALAYSSKHAGTADDDLIALASYPSISSLPEHAEDARAAAQWLEKKLKRIGLQVIERCQLLYCCCSVCRR